MSTREHVQAYVEALPAGTPTVTLPLPWVVDLLRDQHSESRADAAEIETVPASWRERIRNVPPGTQLGTEEVAEALGVGSTFAVHRLKNRQEMEMKGHRPLPFHQPGGKGSRVYFLAGEVVEWMDARVRENGAPAFPGALVAVGVKGPGNPRGAAARRAG